MCDRSQALDSAIATVFPDAKRQHCWIHVYRLFTEGKMKGADRTTLKSLFPAVQAIKNSRTSKQATAMKGVVLNHMRINGWEEVARKFEHGALADRWFTWYIGYIGPSFSPSTNSIESWHRTVKNYPGIGSLHKSTDDLMETVFPNILVKDGELRCGPVTMQPPEVQPAEYVEMATELMDLPSEQAYRVRGSDFYIKYDWSTAKKAGKKVSMKWVHDYESGLKGNINSTTSLSVAVKHYLGLCKVTVPEAVKEDEADDDGLHDYSCDCDLYNMYLTCPHSIFVQLKLGVLDADNLTSRIGRVRGPGRSRKNRGPYSKNDEEPLPKRRRKSTNKY